MAGRLSGGQLLPLAPLRSVRDEAAELLAMGNPMAFGHETVMPGYPFLNLLVHGGLTVEVAHTACSTLSMCASISSTIRS